MTLSTNKAKKLVISASAIAVLALVFLIPTPSRVIGAEVIGAEPADDNAALFKARCALCHAADGSGNTTVGKSMKIRDLRSAEVQSQSDDALYNIMANGKNNKMPAFGKTLGADKCKGLVSFIRTLAPHP